MLMLLDALKIAIYRVSLSIVNIFLFRNVYSLCKMFMGGFYAFVLTVYVSSKIRRKIRERYAVVREKMAKERGQKMFKFDETSLQSIDLDQDLSTFQKFIDYVRKNSESDLFNCMFIASSESSLISLLTILGVEHLNSRYDLSLTMSIFYSVGVSFLLCFGSSFKYMQMLMAEWVIELETIFSNSQTKKEQGEGHSKLRKILLTHTNPFDKSVEYVGLWLSKYDSHRNANKVELKFLTPNYADYIQNLFNFYAKHHMKLEKLKENEENVELLQGERTNKIENYELYVPDYYNGGGHTKLFEKQAKEMGFTSQESWTEFRLFPGVNFNINVYLNTGKQKKQKTN